MTRLRHSWLLMAALSICWSGCNDFHPRVLEGEIPGAQRGPTSVGSQHPGISVIGQLEDGGVITPATDGGPGLPPDGAADYPDSASAPPPSPDSSPPPPEPDSGQPAPTPDSAPPILPGTCGNAFETEVFNLVNSERAAQALPPYECDLEVGQVSQGYSQYMCDADFFDHQGLNGSTVGSRLQAGGVSFTAAGENIAAGQTTPQDVMKAWMNSSGHRANILSSMFTHIGVGYVPCGSAEYRHYWTQNFIRY